MSTTIFTGHGFVDCLRIILPPARIVHVGVGMGTGPIHAWRDWFTGTAWLIDANPASLAWLEPLDASHPMWHVRTATLAASAGQATFYHASSPAESGLIAPAVLRTLWPGLQQAGSETHATVTLDSLVPPGENGPHGDWLLVDCLASLPILHGAGATLGRCSVVWLRTLISALPDAEDGEPASTLPQLDAMLGPLGFSRIRLDECNHPGVAEAIFVRNWCTLAHTATQAHDTLAVQAAALQQALSQARQQCGQQEGLLAERQERLLQLQQALAAQHETALRQQDLARQAAAQQRDEFAQREQQHRQETALLRENLDRLVQENAAQRNALERERDSLQERCDAAERSVVALTDDRNERAWQAAEAQSRVEQMERKTAEHMQHARQCEERMACQAEDAAQQSAALQQAREELAQVRQSLEAEQAAHRATAGNEERLQAQLETAQGRQQQLADQARDRQALIDGIAARDATLQQRDADIAMLTERQHQLDEELMRAEAQIDLIKDVLLREQVS